MSVAALMSRKPNGPAKPLEDVLFAIRPIWSAAKPGDRERFAAACKAAADHCRAKMHEFEGNPYERKFLMLQEGVRFRNEWFAKEPA